MREKYKVYLILLKKEDRANTGNKERSYEKPLEFTEYARRKAW